ncbi:type III-B CRISPR module-associated Cmr3 family protein [Gynuella sp.]|uniref:type III-B CRISPR module-associated Cmr3 family protein n=1 Tax=Gynuella sp. TaxID=2969146 RepID=UPI003D123D88
MDTTMKYYLLEPRDPLIIRSGRPFDEISDAEAARFPPPSTLAGALRNAYARSTGQPLNEALRKLSVSGLLPVKLGTENKVVTVDTLMVPKPADAHYHSLDNSKDPVVSLVSATPVPLADGEGCDLPGAALWPLQFRQTIQGKPVSGPQWWSLKDLLAWRKDAASVSFNQVQKNGWLPAPPDIRTHIAMENRTRSASSGQIFQTTGLNMWQKKQPSETFPTSAIGILGGITGAVTTQWVNLGGERRLTTIEPCESVPQPPVQWLENIAKADGIILTLLTPALFTMGWQPRWLNSDTLIGTLPGLEPFPLQLRAAALGRWQPHSGWNLEKRCPRPARRMVPAGSTYWFEWVGEKPSPEQIASLWFGHVCDEHQDNLDGFGLVLPAPYDSAH